jgi:hypothetical protein
VKFRAAQKIEAEAVEEGEDEPEEEEDSLDSDQLSIVQEDEMMIPCFTTLIIWWRMT